MSHPACVPTSIHCSTTTDVIGHVAERTSSYVRPVAGSDGPPHLSWYFRLAVPEAR